MQSINLLPPKRNSDTRNGAILISILAVSVLLLATQLVLGWHLRATTAAFLQQSAQIDEQWNELHANSGKTEKNNAYKRAALLLAQLEQNRVDWKAYLEALMDPLPASAHIIEMTLGDSNRLHVELEFYQYDLLIQYVKELEQSPALVEVKLESYIEQYGGRTVTDDDMLSRLVAYSLRLDIELNDRKGE